MNFEAGDKVAFINEKQDGFIRSIKANGICVVEIEDGFTIDAHSSELVKIKNIQQKVSEQIALKEEGNEIVNEILPDLISIYSLEGIVAVIAVPDNGKILSGTINYWLVNGSVNEVLFVFSSFKNKLNNGISSGILKEHNSILLSGFPREAIIDISHFGIELLFHQKGNHPQFPRINKEIKVELPTLIQHYPKADSPYSFAIVESLLNFSVKEDVTLNELFEKYQDNPVEQQKVSKPSGVKANKKSDNSLKIFGLSGSSAEVDLHIEELIEDPSGMNPSEMIALQLKHFRKELDKAMYNRSAKIVFIHGIGNGRLKNAIRSELKEIKINYRDGAYDRYGAGATEVMLK